MSAGARAHTAFLLLSSYLSIAFGFELSRDLLGSLLNALHTHFMITVPLFQVLHAGKDRVLDLSLLFCDLFVEFWVQTLQGGDVILLGALHAASCVEVHCALLAWVRGPPTHD